MNRIALFALYAVGLAVVGRAASVFVGADPVALAVCVTMAIVLSGGVLELHQSMQRSDALSRELAGVAKAATDEAVASASPALRGLIRSRLERLSIATPQPIFAPYLVGLLVMLGLLGTFLGLFETLHGAHVALSQSGDLEALRSGLARPISGLVRSFGTSAAGVASSALLGLASVIVRRGAQDFADELAQAVAGPLAHLSPVARELAAIESLADQGRALPLAATSLEQAARALAELGAALPTEQRSALASIEKQLIGATRGLEAELGRATKSLETELGRATKSLETELGRATKGLETGLGKATTAIESGLGKATSAVESGLSKATTSMETSLGRSTTALGERLASTADAIGERLASTASVVESTLGANSDATRRALEAAAVELPARALEQLAPVATTALAAMTEATTAQLAAMTASTSTQLEAMTAAANAQLAGLRDPLEQHTATVVAGLEETRTRTLAGLDETRERTLAALSAIETAQATMLERGRAQHAEALDEALRALEAGERARGEQLAATVAATTAASARELEGIATRLGERLDASLGPVASKLSSVAEDLSATTQGMQRDREAAARSTAAEHERLDALFERLGAASSEVSNAALRQSEAVLRVVSDATQRVEQVEGASEARLGALLDRVDALIVADRDRTAALDAALRESSRATAAEVTALLEARTTALADELAKTQTLVHQAAGLVHAGSAELGSTAAAFAEAVDRHREAADEWLANLGKVEAAVVQATETAASDLLGERLARTHEIFDRQLRFQNELLERVRSLRDSSVGTVSAVHEDEELTADAGE